MVEKKVKDIDALLKNFIQALQSQVHIESVILFGSYGRNEQRDYSDIDVVVVSPDFEGGTERDYLLLDRIARKIHPLLEVIPYRPLDVKDHEVGDFIDEVLRTGRIVYQKAA